MFKVMIVDDELLVRVGIRSTILWVENNFEIIGDAADGEEALELFIDKKPDIVITDIKMPKMNGMELIEKIRVINPDVGVIFLTCFDEIDYLKNAIKMKVNNYLIKATMQPEELLQAVCSLRDELEKKNEGKIEIENMKRIISEQNGKVQSLVLKDIFLGNIGQDRNIDDLLKEGGLKFLYPNFIIIYLQIDEYNLKFREIESSERKRIKNSAINLAEQAIRECAQCFLFELNESDFVCLYSTREGSAASANTLGCNIANRIKKTINSYSSFTVTAAVSSLCKSAHGIQDLYSEVRENLRYKMIIGKNSIITPSEIEKVNRKKTADKFIINFKDIENAVRAVDKKQIDFLISELFKKIEITDDLYNNLNYAGLQLISILNSLCDEYLCVPSSLIGRTHFTIDDLYDYEVLGDIRDFASLQFYDLIDHIKEKKYAGCSHIMQKALKYINENYKNQITLKDVSDYCNLSRTYFCQMFKQAIGETFIDYLNEMRIKSAKDYLLNTDLRNYEIATLVGYADDKYFCRKFKQMEGVTPIEYKKCSKHVQ